MLGYYSEMQAEEALRHDPQQRPYCVYLTPDGSYAIVTEVSEAPAAEVLGRLTDAVEFGLVTTCVLAKNQAGVALDHKKLAEAWAKIYTESSPYLIRQDFVSHPCNLGFQYPKLSG